MANWVEDLHPRDESGRFADKGGAGSKARGGWALDKHDQAKVKSFTHFASAKEAEAAVKAGTFYSSGSLTAVETKALAGYVGKSDAVTLNEYLRAQEAQHPDLVGVQAGLDSIMKHSKLSKSVALYRVLGPEGQKVLRGLDPGDTVESHSFMSATAIAKWTFNPYGAEDHPATIKILAPKGSHALVVKDSFTGTKSLREYEVILDRESSLVYVGEQDGVMVFNLKQSTKARPIYTKGFFAKNKRKGA